MNQEDSERLYQLGKYPAHKQFSQEETNFIKSHNPKNKYIIKYAIWRQERINNAYACFIYDLFPGRTRKCAADYSLDVICTREPTDAEYDELIDNYGNWSRVMHMWEYKTIEGLINDELLNGNKVPEKFIKEFNYRKEYGFTKNQQKEHRNQFTKQRR